MEQLMKRVAGICLCSWLWVVIHAQADALRAIQKIYTAYNTAGTLRFKGSLKMYRKNDPGKIIEKMQSNYIMNGANFSCCIGSVEMLLNDNYYVSVDKTIKLIMIGHKQNLSATEPAPVLNTGQFASWIKEKRIEAGILAAGASSVLQLRDPGGLTGYNLYRIEYDSITGYMKKVLLETVDYNDPFRKAMVLEIRYTNPVLTQKNKNIFSERKFFSVHGNSITLTSQYKGYQLISQL